MTPRLPYLETHQSHQYLFQVKNINVPSHGICIFYLNTGNILHSSTLKFNFKVTNLFFLGVGLECHISFFKFRPIPILIVDFHNFICFLKLQKHILIFHLMRNISVSNCKKMEGVPIISLSFVIELTNWMRSAASLRSQISRGRTGPNDRSRSGRSHGGLHTTPHRILLHNNIIAVTTTN